MLKERVEMPDTTGAVKQTQKVRAMKMRVRMSNAR
jgi:hypothetical protein